MPKHGSSIRHKSVLKEINRRWDDSSMQAIESLVKEGYSQKEIGKICGVSHQRIAQLMGARGKSYMRTKPRSVYRGLSDWMIENDITYTTLNSMMGYTNCASSAKNLSARLMGRTELRMRDIDKLIDLSGKTYEELFGKEVDGNSTT